VGAALAYAFGVIRPAAERGAGLTAYDIYAYFYPNVAYALDSLGRGSGLLWNPYQNCGQPFFGISLNAVLYPLHWVFALLPREPALLASLVLHLSVGGVGVWWLGRELGLSHAAALGGAFAFQLSGSAPYLAAWSPMHVGPYAWLPVALAALERLLRTLALRDALALAVILALQLLVGFPQISVFTYQLVALRVGWALVTREAGRPLPLLALCALALALPPLLTAAQFVPALEVARDSIRSLPLRPEEIGGGASVSNMQRDLPGVIFTAATAALGALGLLAAATRRAALFYGIVAAAYLLLALGPDGPLFALYTKLPGGGMFRFPVRFLWVATFALAMLAALGTEAVTRGRERWGPRSRAAVAAALAAGVGVAFRLAPKGLAPAEVGILLALLAAVAAALWRPRLGPLAAAAMAGALALDGLLVFRPLLSHRVGDVYAPHADALERVRERLGPADRVVLRGWQSGFETDMSLTHKIATLYRLPSIYDYEPQASLRYAQYFTYMRLGRPLRAVFDWYYPNQGLLPRSLRRPLFDLTAARWLIVDARVDDVAAVLGPSAPQRFRSGNVVVYENTSALPRAFFVPTLERVPEDQVLAMLADGRVDPRRTALVGVRDGAAAGREGGDASGSAAIVRNDPQDLEIEVAADGPGFLFLADQYAPGWVAEVNGRPAEILAANHAFRLVAVPEGRSRVAFHYRPLGVRIGALVSAATGLLVAALWVRSRRGALPT
jgi:hypothetical protein